MKRIKIISMSLALLSLGMTSCNDWFDVIPRSSVYEDDLYSKEQGFQSTLTGLYISLGENNLYGRELTFGITDVVSGIYYLPKINNNSYKYAGQYNYEYSSTKSTITGIWNSAYNVIANANVLLEKIGVKQDVDTENTASYTLSDKFNSVQTRSIIAGEALAVRALMHFDLLRLYGANPQVDATKPSIPYVTTLQKNATPQSTTSEIIQKVITDLLQAESLLKDNDPIVEANAAIDDTYFKKSSRATHLNYYAVCGLLARAYQYAGDNKNAGKWAKVVIDSNAFTWNSLTDWQKSNYVATKELLFNLYISNMKDQQTPYFKNTDGSGDDGKLLMMSSQRYSDLYSNADKRAKGFMAYQGNYLCQKYVVTEGEVADSLTVQHRIPILRLSEMYYILAESYLAEGKTSEAANTLNTELKAYGLKNVDLSTSENIRKCLDLEYQREFVAEGQWFFYIKRRNASNLIETQYVVDFIFPLPDNEYTYANRQKNK